jgi:hypothetical protein
MRQDQAMIVLMVNKSALKGQGWSLMHKNEIYLIIKEQLIVVFTERASLISVIRTFQHGNMYTLLFSMTFVLLRTKQKSALNIWQEIF